MSRGVNLHELARDVTDPLRREFPARFLDLEHRGDGDAEWEGDDLADALGAMLRHAFAQDASDASVWVRTSGAGDELRIDIAWHGAEPGSDLLRAATAAAAARGGIFDLKDAPDRAIRATWSLPRRT